MRLPLPVLLFLGSPQLTPLLATPPLPGPGSGLACPCLGLSWVMDKLLVPPQMPLPGASTLLEIPSEKVTYVGPATPPPAVSPVPTQHLAQCVTHVRHLCLP